MCANNCKNVADIWIWEKGYVIHFFSVRYHSAFVWAAMWNVSCGVHELLDRAPPHQEDTLPIFIT